MLAVRYTGYGSSPELVEMPSPVCPDDGVVLDVLATGVCRSDWHAWRGHDPVSLPHVPGHELAGVINQVGREVTDFGIGDLVTTPFVNGCGRCELCRGGDAQVCPAQTQPGFTHHGSFAEQVALFAADTNLVRLPAGMDPVVAASLGCRFATAYRAVTAHGRVGEGDWVAVYGCGGVGLSAIQIALALGARVVAVDVAEPARRRATELGATSLEADGANGANGADGANGAVERIIELTGGGAHLAIDALGSAATSLAGVRSLRRRGRYVQVGLMLGEDARTPLPWDLVVSYELEVYGSHGMAARDYPALLAMVSSGVLRPHELVGRVITLAEAPAALMAMDSPTASTAGMTVIDLGRD